MILEKDKDIVFPHFTLLKASAGSGKTHTITKRYIQFLLSKKPSGNSLKSIIAITFSKNAAKEMKERILEWLKALCFKDQDKINELSEIISLSKSEIEASAEELITKILDNYSDFQVKTIDSFMTSIFRASALDFGYDPDFEILMNSDSVLNYSFDLLLRKAGVGTAEGELLEEVTKIVENSQTGESKFLWDPSKKILEEVKTIYKILSSYGKEVLQFDPTKDMEKIKNDIREKIIHINSLINKSGLTRNKNDSCDSVLKAAENNRFVDLIGKGFKLKPVNKPKTITTEYEEICDEWEKIADLVADFGYLFSKNYYLPYIKVFKILEEGISKVKKRERKVFIEDISHMLSTYISKEIVPDVYFQIGEIIYHYLIDEFQDTSPIQWKNLKPLIENPLSESGTLFAVGDTKQAIYGFRNADYRIMKSMEKDNPFPSALHQVKELDINFRSYQAIVDFNDLFFKDKIKKSKFNDVAELSGLTDYVQLVKEEFQKKGYVEISLFEKESDSFPEKEKIFGILSDLKERGYKYQDIAILAPRNDDVVKVSTWLNEKDIPFLSYSSLDIRTRKIIGEVIALLMFLNSPMDDLAFSTFCLGEIIRKFEGEHKVFRSNIQEILFANREVTPKYKVFQKEFPEFWRAHFDPLFKVTGYYQPYDLLTEIYRIFDLFHNFGEEEAALSKMLEIVKEAEEAGITSLTDFFSNMVDKDKSEADWNISIPSDMDAVSVMTVHKSKGLGFPIVIDLLYEGKNKGYSYLIKEDENEIALLRGTQKLAECNLELETLYTEAKVNDDVSKLNQLYVGFTRAKRELYVIGVGEIKNPPLSLISNIEFKNFTKTIKGVEKERLRAAPLLGSYFLKPLSAASEHKGKLNIKNRKRGELFHKLLYSIDFITAEFEKEFLQPTLFPAQRAEENENEIRKCIVDFILDEKIKNYFTYLDGRIVSKEREFVNSSGRLYRMDRVIIDKHTVTLLEFKTGKDETNLVKFREQVVNYMAILSDVYKGKEIEGVIAHVERREILSVG